MWFYLRGGLFGGAVERHPVRFKGTGEFVVIVGSSGSGKTTLLSIFSGLDRPTSGRVVMAGRDFTDLSEEELAPVRNTLPGFVFQAYHLAPSLNALENVMFPAELRGDEMAMEKVHKLIERYGSMMGDWSKAGRGHDHPLALSLAGNARWDEKIVNNLYPTCADDERSRFYPKWDRERQSFRHKGISVFP